jgi:hypothetical protein
VLDLPFDFARSFPANYSEFPNSWARLHLALGNDVLEVLIDGSNGYLEQFRDERLAQPKRFVHKTALDPGAAVLCLVQDDFAGWGCGLVGCWRLVLWHSGALYGRS